MRNRAVLVASLVGAMLTGIGPRSASSHEFWLSPSTYAPTHGDTVTMRVYVGTGFRGEPKPYATKRTLEFTMQGERRIDLAPQVTNGELRWALFIPPDDGGQVLAFRSQFAFIELEPQPFDRYLADEGLDAPLAARRSLGAKVGPGRERYARCAKSWIAGSDPNRALKPQGLPLEIVPLADPDGSPHLTVRVLYQGKPLGNALVRTWNLDLATKGRPYDGATRDSIGRFEQRRTAADGTATLDVSRPGEWLFNVVHMVPSESDEADWQSLWASFTFARGARGRR